jgi:hypothetical protein
MVLLFESDWTNFSDDPNIPVEIVYSSSGIEASGLKASMIELLGRDGEEYGFPAQYDGYGKEILRPYFINSVSETVLVYKPENYVFSGQFRVSVYN